MKRSQLMTTVIGTGLLAVCLSYQQCSPVSMTGSASESSLQKTSIVDNTTGLETPAPGDGQPSTPTPRKELCESESARPCTCQGVALTVADVKLLSLEVKDWKAEADKKKRLTPAAIDGFEDFLAYFRESFASYFAQSDALIIPVEAGDLDGLERAELRLNGQAELLTCLDVSIPVPS